jgi:hypothetical protein
VGRPARYCLQVMTAVRWVCVWGQAGKQALGQHTSSVEKEPSWQECSGGRWGRAGGASRGQQCLVLSCKSTKPVMVQGKGEWICVVGEARPHRPTPLPVTGTQSEGVQGMVYTANATLLNRCPGQHGRRCDVEHQPKAHILEYIPGHTV